MVRNFIITGNYIIVKDITLHAHLCISAKRLYEEYKQFCKEESVICPSIAMFSKQLLSIHGIRVYHLNRLKTYNLQFVPECLQQDERFHKRIETTRYILGSYYVSNPNQDTDILLSAITAKQLTKEEQIKILVAMQKNIGRVALGQYETYTTKFDFETIDGREVLIPKNRVVQTHLPNLEYIDAFERVGRLIDGLSATTDVWETNDEATQRYLELGLKKRMEE
jgi:hypothetical protein